MLPSDGPPRRIRDILVELDAVSPGEAIHARRVAVYAVATAERLGLNVEALRIVRDAALLHDVGKINLDAATLRKIGQLTEDEIEEMRRHAEEAVAVLCDAPEGREAVPLVRAHHERWDGGGYPLGLRGEEIPLGARIIGLAEAYDVTSAGAAWMRPLGAARAREQIEAGSGTEWDPSVVEAFLAVQPLIQPSGMAE